MIFPPCLSGRLRSTLAYGDMDFFDSERASLGKVHVRWRVEMQCPPLLGYLRSYASADGTAQRQPNAPPDPLSMDWGDNPSLIDRSTKDLDVSVIYDMRREVARTRIVQELPSKVLTKLRTWR